MTAVPSRVFTKGEPMRVLCFLILLLVLAAFAIFAVQNQESITLQYFDRSATCSLALLVGVVYLVGMVSGWTVFTFLTRSFRRMTERRAN